MSRQTPLYAGKRACDLSVGLVLSLLTLPLVVLIAIGSLVCFRANPFFVQHRIGLDGRSFGVIKLRSLPTTIRQDANRRELEESHEASGWSRFLRTTHFDELPQLWQVVVGQMSLVGPRPMIPGIVAHMNPGFTAQRHAVRPGLTGLWQISEAGIDLILSEERLDTLYIERACFALDARILVATLLQTLGARRYRRDEIYGWFTSQVRSVASGAPDRSLGPMSESEALPPSLLRPRAFDGVVDGALRPCLDPLCEEVAG